MRAEISRPATELPILSGAMITLPDGSELMVDSIPYEGWGTAPGKRWSLAQLDEHGNVLWTTRWTT